MKKTIVVLSALLLVSLMFYFNPGNVVSSTTDASITVCLKENCRSCTPCMSCGSTFTIYHADGTPASSACVISGLQTCCTVSTLGTPLPAGNYYFTIDNLCFKGCQGAQFYYDPKGKNVTVTFDCSGCADKKSKN